METKNLAFQELDHYGFSSRKSLSSVFGRLRKPVILHHQMIFLVPLIGCYDGNKLDLMSQLTADCKSVYDITCSRLIRDGPTDSNTYKVTMKFSQVGKKSTKNRLLHTLSNSIL